MANTKTCRKCGRELPITEFSKNKNNKDGLQTWCKQCKKQYRKANKERITEYYAEWYQANKEKKDEYNAEYYQANKEKFAEWYQANKEKKDEYIKQYRTTPIGRALNLLGMYRQSDKIHNRGEGDLTPQWIVDNIFSKQCHYCGESDWRKIGCDRIYNDKPHTMDNVVPCCGTCNVKRGRMNYLEFVELMQKAS